MKKRKKTWLIIIIVVVIVLVMMGLKSCGKAKKAALKLTGQQEESYIVKRGDIVSTIEITGEIQPQVTVQIKSKVSGKVVKFYVDENDYVKTGQIIADIEPDYNQASTLSNIKTRLASSEIRLKNARKDLTDKQALLTNNYVTQKEVTAAEDEYSSAQLEYAQALQQYDLVKELDTKGTVTHVYATASGTAIQRPVQEGEMITSSNSAYGEGSVILKVADLGKMIVKSNINEVDIAKFRLGQSATVKVDALPYEEFSGKITKIAAMASTVNNAIVFPVEISLGSPSAKLKPGMTGNVSITGETRKDVLVIPIRAVFTDDKSQDIVYLYKAKADTTVAKSSVKTAKSPALKVAPQTVATPVKLGGNDLQNVEVLEGLKEGDKISLTEQGKASTTQMNFGEF
jgi:HlyD family secretion protein